MFFEIELHNLPEQTNKKLLLATLTTYLSQIKLHKFVLKFTTSLSYIYNPKGIIVPGEMFLVNLRAPREWQYTQSEVDEIVHILVQVMDQCNLLELAQTGCSMKSQFYLQVLAENLPIAELTCFELPRTNIAIHH